MDSYQRWWWPHSLGTVLNATLSPTSGIKTNRLDIGTIFKATIITIFIFVQWLQHLMVKDFYAAVYESTII